MFTKVYFPHIILCISQTCKEGITKERSRHLKDLFQFPLTHLMWCDRFLKLAEKKVQYYPVDIYLLKVNKGSTSKMCEICSQLIIKKSGQSLWHCSGVFIVNFGQISLIALMSLRQLGKEQYYSLLLSKYLSAVSFDLSSESKNIYWKNNNQCMSYN